MEAYSSIYKPQEGFVEEVEIAAQYFYEMGLNEYGVDILVEELGEEEFAEFVYDIAEEYVLTEARAGGVKIEPVTKSGKSVGSLKGGPKTSAINRLRKEKQAARSGEGSGSGSSGMKAALQRQSAIASAQKKQPNKGGTQKGIAGRVGAALGSIVKKGKEDIKRVQDAAQTARDVASRRGAEAAAVYTAARNIGKKAEQSAAATRARRKATVAAGRAARVAAPVVKKAVMAGAAAAGAGAGSLKSGKSPAAAAGRAAGTFARKMKEDYDLFDYILEHLVSEGYADTNENALVIMANMSEEWKQSIVEADSLAAQQERRRKRLEAQRKREGRPSGGGDFGHDYSKSHEQNRAEIEQRMRDFINKKG